MQVNDGGHLLTTGTTLPLIERPLSPGLGPAACRRQKQDDVGVIGGHGRLPHAHQREEGQVFQPEVASTSRCAQTRDTADLSWRGGGDARQPSGGTSSITTGSSAFIADFQSRIKGLKKGNLKRLQVAIPGEDRNVSRRPERRTSIHRRRSTASPRAAVYIDAASQGPGVPHADGGLALLRRPEDMKLFQYQDVRSGCSFGPVCRIGCEIEESVVHGFSKYPVLRRVPGPNSYVGSWVNPGSADAALLI